MSIDSLDKLPASWVRSFADAFNTVLPTANGAKGEVPSYALVDFNATLHLTDRYTLRLGINNLMNKSYFTKRPAFYPGPGIWPSDGRGVVVTVGVKI